MWRLSRRTPRRCGYIDRPKILSRLGINVQILLINILARLHPETDFSVKSYLPNLTKALGCPDPATTIVADRSASIYYRIWCPSKPTQGKRANDPRRT
jgi:hypothetical protein